MPKNLQLLNSFNTIGFQNKPELERNKALDDILKSDPANAVAFRKAITDNSAFWSLVINDFIKLPDPAHWGSVIKNKLLPTSLEDYLKSDDFLELTANPSFAQIYKMAAQQRVSLGLKSVSNEVLTKILANNQDQVRAYLASKDLQIVGAFGDLTQASAWVANMVVNPPANPPAAPLNQSKNVLTDEAIAAIQDNARDELLLRAIKNEAITISALQAFATANNALIMPPKTAEKTQALATATQALQLPNEIRRLLGRPFTTAVESALTARKQNAAKEAFKTSVERVSTSVLAGSAIVNVLKTNNLADFRQSLVGFLNDDDRAAFNEDDINWAKGSLGLRHFETILPKTPSDRLIAALQADNNDVFRTALAAILNSPGYPIDQIAIPENQATLKKAILQSVINSIEDVAVLKRLERAVDLTRFKAEVTNLGVASNNWIENKHLADLKQTVRSRLLEKYVASYSKLGIDAHPQLFKVFAGLSIAKQQEILSRPQDLRHILHATTEQAIHKLWGESIVVNDLIAENNRVNAFNQIHNAAVAKILASNPQIVLNPDNIITINNLLMSPPIRPDTFTAPAAYQAWVTLLARNCPGADANFPILFGLQGNAFQSPAANAPQNLIKDQCSRNQALQTAYDDDTRVVYQPLIGVFLGLAKTNSENFDANHINGDILRHFNQAKNAGMFIENYTRAGNYSQIFKNQLTNELTAEVFNRVKNNIRKSNLANNAAMPVAVAEISGKMKILQALRVEIEGNAEKLRFINRMQSPASLYYPVLSSTKNKADAAEMQTKYKSIAADVELMISELTRSARLLQGYLDSLPDRNAAGTPAAINNLRADLEAELNKMDSDLSYCQLIQGKLSGPDGLIQVATEAAQGKTRYVYQGNMEYRSCLPTEVRALVNEPAGSAQDVVVQAGGGREISHFLLKEKIGPGQVGEYNVKIGNLRGQFIEQPGKPLVTSRNGEVKTSPGKFTLKQFPTSNPAPRTPEEINAQKRARIEFSMTMAIQILASLDGPPTKSRPLLIEGENQEAVGHLWTALVLLGEKNPHLKFGPEAITVYSSTFNPLQERDEGIIASLGSVIGKSKFSANSIYTEKFTDHAAVASLEKAKEHLAELTSKKFDPQHDESRKEVDKSATEVTESYRTQFDSVRQRAKQNIEAEGPVPVPPVRPRNN